MSKTLETTPKAEDKEIKVWLAEIGVPEKADDYAKLFALQEYRTLKDLTSLLPSDQNLKDYGIIAGKHRNQILAALKSTQVNQGIPFDPSKYQISFPNFEPNDDFSTIVSRSEQLNKIRDGLANLLTHQKFRPVVICTSRGMGKTFLLKRLGYHLDRDNIDIPSIKTARDVGRVIGVECASFAQQLLQHNQLYKFWNVAIIQHICHLFNNHVVGDLFFCNMQVSDILNIPPSTPQNLCNWIENMLKQSFADVCLELIRLTNLAFGTNIDCRPVFLLDNVHELAQRETKVPSVSKPMLFHTELSLLLNRAAPYRVPIILAGTTDGKLDILTEHSNILPLTIHLGILSYEDIQIIGRDYVTYRNKNQGTEVPWPDNCKSDLIFMALMHSSCKIPRLVKLALEQWYTSKLKSGTLGSALVDFSFVACEYYKDAQSFILSYNAQDFSKLVLACSVHLPLESTIPGTSLLLTNLEQKSIIFRNADNTYIVPLLWWDPARKRETQFSYPNDAKISARWDDVQHEITRLVPGLELDSLHISISRLAHFQIHDTKMGHIWENLFASSLAVKYKLLKLQDPKKDIRLSEILGTKESTYIDTVDLSEGVHYPTKEAKVGCSLPRAVCVNLKVNNAHHDIVVSNTIGVSCKYSLQKPDGKDVVPQLVSNGLLLWCFLGADNMHPGFGTVEVENALTNKKLAFISGRGIVSNLMIDLLNEMKKTFSKTK